MVQHHSMRSGPLPDAEELERYNQVVPGAAERIIRMAEKEQDAAHTALRRELNLKTIGLASGSVMAWAGIGLAYYMVFSGSDHIHYVIASIAGLVGVALTGRMILQRRREAK